MGSIYITFFLSHCFVFKAYTYSKLWKERKSKGQGVPLVHSIHPAPRPPVVGPHMVVERDVDVLQGGEVRKEPGAGPSLTTV